MKLLYYLLSFIAGICLTFQANKNGQLRLQVNNPILSSLISFVIGSVCLCIALNVQLISKSYTISTQTFSNVRWWMLLGGILGAIYIFSSILIPERIGFSVMFCLIIAGQMISTILVENFGLLGNPIQRITPQKAIGVFLLLVSVYLIRKK